MSEAKGGFGEPLLSESCRRVGQVPSQKVKVFFPGVFPSFPFCVISSNLAPKGAQNHLLVDFGYFGYFGFWVFWVFFFLAWHWPKKFTVAMPLFSWGPLHRRGGRDRLHVRYWEEKS